MNMKSKSLNLQIQGTQWRPGVPWRETGASFGSGEIAWLFWGYGQGKTGQENGGHIAQVAEGTLGGQPVRWGGKPGSGVQGSEL